MYLEPERGSADSLVAIGGGYRHHTITQARDGFMNIIAVVETIGRQAFVSVQQPSRTRRFLTLAGMIHLACGHRLFASPAAAAGGDFPVFDALLHRGKPNLTRQGLRPMGEVSSVWRPGSPHSEFDERGVLAALNRLSPEATTIFVDIEEWPLLGASEEVRQRSIDNFLATAKIIRRTLPRVQFGFYGIAPTIAYWPIVGRKVEELADWRKTDRLMRSVVDQVDFLFPCLYTFYDDRAGWRRFALATLEEARQYGKPVYPFLWFEYFDGNPILRDHEVPVAAWKDELILCRERADGVVLWGGYQRNWSESAQWWQAALEILHPRFGNRA
jgi:hypothetical protein